MLPARAGSKSIPAKNSRPIAGRPLVAWTISAALEATSVDELIVATNDDAVATCAAQLGARVHRRTAASATDTAPTEMVLLEALDPYADWDFVLLQATSPLTSPGDIDAAVTLHREGGFDSVLSVVPQSRFLWREGADGAEAVNYDPRTRPRRQEVEPLLVENGAIYVSSTSLLRETQSRLGGRVGLYSMDAATYHELDEPEDWAVVERLLEARSRFAGEAEIRLVLSDVDGVLTDNGMYWSSDGAEMKKFSARDGKGFERLHHYGMKTALLTSESRELVRHRGQKLGCHAVVLGCRDKVQAADSIRRELGLTWEQIAFIGDDLHDVDLLLKVGLSSAPADAVPEAKAAANHHLTAAGGQGCFRELAELVISSRQLDPSPAA